MRINRKRVFIGGLAGGLVWFFWSSLVNALILGAQYKELTGSGLLLEEQRYSFFVGAWALTLMVLSMILAWLYAAARVTLGAGPGTALTLGLQFFTGDTLTLFLNCDINAAAAEGTELGLAIDSAAAIDSPDNINGAFPLESNLALIPVTEPDPAP